MKHDKNPDIDVLCYKKQRLCCVPKQMARARFFTDWVSEERNAPGYTTSHGAKHRSWNGIGMVLLVHKLITPKKFVDHFISRRQKREFMGLVQGIVKHQKSVSDLLYYTKKFSGNKKYK